MKKEGSVLVTLRLSEKNRRYFETVNLLDRRTGKTNKKQNISRIVNIAITQMFEHEIKRREAGIEASNEDLILAKLRAERYEIEMQRKDLDQKVIFIAGIEREIREKKLMPEMIMKKGGGSI